MKHKRFASGEVNLLIVALAAVSVFMVVFAVLAIVSYMDSRRATSSLNAAKATSYTAGEKAGAAAQKKTDDEAARVAAASPFAAYEAPTAFGNFEIKYPKNWSASVTENEGATTQVDLIATPTMIKTRAGKVDNYALHVKLNKTNFTTSQRAYDDKVKQGKLKAKSVTIFGLDGMRYEGQYDDKHSGIVVIVPVRDKTMFFSTEDTKYSADFEQVLVQSKIIP